MAYSEKVLDHYENPRNVGSFTKEEEGIGTGMVGAPACGDVMKLQIKVNKEGVIEDAKFKTYGCQWRCSCPNKGSDNHTPGRLDSGNGPETIGTGDC